GLARDLEQYVHLRRVGLPLPPRGRQIRSQAVLNGRSCRMDFSLSMAVNQTFTVAIDLDYRARHVVCSDSWSILLRALLHSLDLAARRGACLKRGFKADRLIVPFQ